MSLSRNSDIGFSQRDCIYMSRAIELAKRGLFTTKPNPRVGCVITDAQGDNGNAEQAIVGEGWHQRAGEPHAEVYALRQAGDKANGATAYVTLEPCSHQGRTGPCAQALIDAKVARVVIAMTDPNPLVSGRGIAMLETAGIAVDVGLYEEQARSLNPGFISRMESNRPYVRIKLAMSLDGRTAMASGESQWITGPQARADVQALRARSSAVITGSGTLKYDNPSLRVRPEELPEGSITLDAPDYEELVQPVRVLLDTQDELSGDEAVFGAPGRVLHVSQGVCELGGASAQDALINRVHLPRDESGFLSIDALLTLLAKHQCNEVLVEAGAKLAGQFIAQGFCDELWVYMAPKLMGSDARPLVDLPLANMAEARSLSLLDFNMVGDDIRFRYTLAH